MSLEIRAYNLLRGWIDFAGCLSCVLILSLNLWILHSLWIGTLCFISYSVFVSRGISRRLTFLDRAVVLPLSFVFWNLLLGALSAIVIGLSIPISNELLVVFLLVPLLFFFSKKCEKQETIKIVEKTGSVSLILLLVFSLSILGMLYALLLSRTGETIPYFQSNLNSSYYIFNFIAIVSTVLIALSRCSLRAKLIVISSYSVVSLLFRYVIYVVAWGSDTWDNLQGALWLHGGGVLQLRPNLYYYLARSDNAYLSLWGINVSTSRITGISLFSLYPYVGVLLAFAIPLIMYQIAKSLVNNEIYALIVALMSFFLWDTFYWLSFSSANGLGILGMLFSLLFWILYLKNEKMSIFLPLVMTVLGILAYQFTGIFVAVIAILSISMKRRGVRKNVAIMGFLSCLILPLYDVYTHIAYFVVSGASFPIPSFLSVGALVNKLIFPSQRSFDLYRFNLNNVLDLPYLVIYVLVAIGIILGRKQIKREIYFLLLVVLASVFSGEVYALWSQSRTYLRIGTTILPWLFLILSCMSFNWVYTHTKKILHSHFSLNSASHLVKKYLIQPKTLFVISLCIIIGVASTCNFFFSPTTNTHNASSDQVNALKYVMLQNPSKDALIISDGYTLKILSALSDAHWYHYPYGERLWLDALTLTTPMYYQVLSDPSTVQLSLQEGVTSVTNTLSKLNITCNVNKFYFIYSADMMKYDYHTVSQNFTETMFSYFGEPVVFGNVIVYSGYIPKKVSYGWITQLNDNQMQYSVTLDDLKVVVV